MKQLPWIYAIAACMALMLIEGCHDDRLRHNLGLYHDSEAVFCGYLLLMGLGQLSSR